VHILERVVKMGFNVLYSDMDVAWLRNPLNYFTSTPQQMSMIVSTDLLLAGGKMHDEGLEVPRLSANINTGGPLRGGASCRWLLLAAAAPGLAAEQRQAAHSSLQSP
jgi:hypothetical protein